MRRIFHVARRELISTVTTKGFLIGVLIMPGLMIGAIFFINLLWNETPPPVTGTVAVIDHSGMLADKLVAKINPDVLAREHDDEIRRQAEALARKAGINLTGDPMGMTSFLTKAQKKAGPASDIRVKVLPPDTDPEKAKEPLREGSVKDGGQLVLVVIDKNAVVPDKKGNYGSYAWYDRAKLDDRIQSNLKRRLKQTIIEARAEQAGQNADQLRKMMVVRARESRTITASGEVSSGANEMLSIMMPMAFMMLLWVSTFTGGQYLLTTTIEEKSSRVIEVLLSAVSPVQLMTGKILGQMVVGLLILLIYAGLGMGAMVTFSLLGFIDAVNLVYLVIFFFIAFFFLASMMAAIGSAVNDMREAQSLMTPVMLVLIIPMMLWMPISRDPNSTLATVLSFLPPISPFAMVIRLGSTEPVPLWQTILSIVIGIISVYFMVRIAAKVFRVGVLMYGKPPNLVTLLKWIRMA